MLELELFFKIVEAAIREAQANYLKPLKRVPVPQELPVVNELTEKEFKELKFFDRLKYKRKIRKQIKERKRALKRVPITVDDKLLKGYNKGIETALSTLQSEFKAYIKRFEVPDKGSKRY